MSQAFEVQFPDDPEYVRKVLFAVELLDAVTLSRVSEGVRIEADGLRGKPIVNQSGLFVWLKEDINRLRKLRIDPKMLQYESAEIQPDELLLPPLVTTVALSPRADYAFAAGITGLRGTLIESRVVAPPGPVPKAEVRLRWLDEDGVTWRENPTTSVTTARGDFTAFLRLGPADAPLLDANAAVTVRVRVTRDEGNPRGSTDLKLPQGRIADPSTFAQGPGALILAWDELQP